MYSDATNKCDAKPLPLHSTTEQQHGAHLNDSAVLKSSHSHNIAGLPGKMLQPLSYRQATQPWKDTLKRMIATIW